MTPITPTTPTSDRTSSLETHFVALLVVVVALIITIWQPEHVSLIPAAQAAVVAAGLLVAGIVEAVHVVTRNGITKAGIEKTVTEEAAWVKANYAELRSSFEQAKPALVALPGFRSAVDAISGEVQAVKKDVGDVKATVASLPAGQRTAAAAAVREIFGALDAPQAAVQPAAVTVETEPPGPGSAPAPTQTTDAAPTTPAEATPADQAPDTVSPTAPAN